MEVLKLRLYNDQKDLEDALRMEATYEEAKEDKEGKRLLTYLKKRRRTIINVLNALEKVT